jgi:hypothetical protein
MTPALRSHWNRRVVAASVLGLVVLVALIQLSRIVSTRSECAQVERRKEDLSEQIAEFVTQLAAERAGRERAHITRGRGPGGIYSPWESYLFDGPTAAQSALDLALVADETFFREFRYVGDDSRVLSTFPTEASDEHGMTVVLPVRERYHLVEWPLEMYLESDYGSVVGFLKQLTFSTPGIALREVELEVHRDEQDLPTGRVTFTALLSTYWLRKESAS